MRLDFSAADRAELQFEVDILQSSDEDKNDDGGEDEGGHHMAHRTEKQSTGTRTRKEPISIEPQSDAARQKVLEQQVEDERKAYVEFLTALFAKDGTDNSIGQQNLASSKQGSRLPSQTLLPDDDPNEDPNFDYLTAASCFPEDNEEYRDDPAVRVSQREISDLIASLQPVSRPTRTAGKKVPDANVPSSNASTQSRSNVFGAPAAVQSAPVFISASFQPQELRETIRMQMATHVQLLLHLHVNSPPCSTTAVRSAAMLQELVQMRDVTLAYKRTFAPFAKYPAVGSKIPSGSLDSFFNAPILGLAPSVLAAAASAIRSSPSQILASCGISGHVPLANMQLTAPQEKSLSNGDWSETEDKLLAYILQTRGAHNNLQNPLEPKWSLLPHRSDAQCEARVRELSSRRMRDNPVKQVILNSATDEALTKEEWKRVRPVVDRIGEGDWERIAREALVNKRPEVIEREWRFRTSKSLAKRKERMRAKLRREKAASGSGPASSS